MKHLITYPSSQNKPSQKPGVPSPPGVRSRFNAAVELTPLQDFIDDVAARFVQVMETDNYARLCKLGKILQKARGKLEAAKAHNFKTGLKWSMLRRKEWRAKVLETLGGEDALQVWERKAAKAQGRATNPKPYTAPAYKRPLLMSLRLGYYKLPPLRDPFDVKTDESGSFRLAPIPNPRPKRPDDYEKEELTWRQAEDQKEARHLKARLRLQQELNAPPVDETTLKGYWYKDETTNTIIRLAPIPLLPDELRGVGIDDEDVEGPNNDEQQGDTFNPSPRLRGEVAEISERSEDVDRAAGRVDGGTLSSISPSHGSQTIEPPIDPRRCAPGPLPPASGEKGVIAHAETIIDLRPSGTQPPHGGGDDTRQDNTYVEGTD